MYHTNRSGDLPIKDIEKMKNTRKMMAFLIGITLLTISPAYADHDRAVTTEQMPRQAQEFIARYFPGEKIAYAKKKAIFSKSFTK
ncbi:hypothetical protein [Alistipes putredinis]|uniref:hypothetical protein n=1 Tax=Alistipes putredinis TaxID=28117 RepID=UPI003AB15410